MIAFKLLLISYSINLKGSLYEYRQGSVQLKVFEQVVSDRHAPAEPSRRTLFTDSLLADRSSRIVCGIFFDSIIFISNFLNTCVCINV